MTMIIGIGTEMAIFYVSEFDEMSRHMPPAQATAEASRNRVRADHDDDAAAILTLLPLALAIGQGSGIQQPLSHRDYRRVAAAIPAGPAGNARARSPDFAEGAVKT